MKHNTMKVVLSLCLTIKNQNQEQNPERVLFLFQRCYNTALKIITDNSKNYYLGFGVKAYHEE